MNIGIWTALGAALGLYVFVQGVMTGNAPVAGVGAALVLFHLLFRRDR